MPPGAYFFLAEGFTGILIVSGTPVSGLTFGHDLNLTLSDPSSCTALPKPLHELQCHTNSGVTRTPVSGLTFGHGLNLNLSNPSACTALSKPWHAT